MRQFWACWLGLAAGLAAAPASQDPPPPSQQAPATFRTKIDVVAVDVSVIDRAGRPVADLTPEEFTLTVDGTPRRIRSAEFVSLRREGEVVDPSRAAATSRGQAPGRLIALVIDQANIHKGTGRETFSAAVNFVDALNDADRVSLHVIPGTGPIVDFTSDHEHVKRMLERATGQATEAESTGRVGVSEAIAIIDMDDALAWAAVVDRECPSANDTATLNDCRAKLNGFMRTVYTDARFNAIATLGSLRGIIERLGRTAAPKTLVLISEGLVVDRNSADLGWVAPRTAAAQVTLFGIQLGLPLIDAGMKRTSPTREADQQLLIDGMNYIVGLGRGTVFPVAVNANAVFARLDLELSGYYLLGFEPTGSDRDGKPHNISVKVRRDGAIVRARPQFSAEPLGTVAATDQLLTQTMQSALPASDFGLRVATFSYRDDISGKIKAVVAAEFDRVANPSGAVSLAYTVTSQDGKVHGAGVEKDLVAANGAEGLPQQYLSSVVVDPGAYTLKVAAVDATGLRASVEHTFRAGLTPVGQVRLGELMLARPPNSNARAQSLLPLVDARFDSGALVAYVELYSDAEPQLERVTLALEVAADEEARPLAGGTMAMATPRAGKRIAQGTISASSLAPGQYVVRAVLIADGKSIGRVTRPLTIDRSGPVTPKPETARPVAPIAVTSRVDAFDRQAVLTRPVVAFFVDRMFLVDLPETPAALTAAVGYARSGQFAQVLNVVDAAQSSHVHAQFLGGLAHFAQGDLQAAAASFAGALKTTPSFTPAVFYLGASFAASGQDREAILAWRSAMITDASAPWIYTLLADAHLRRKEVAQALDLLREATRLWPNDDSVQMRWATGLAMSGQADLAVKALDPYLSRHPEDGERLLLGMRLVYEARVGGRPIESADADRARFLRYFDLYQKIAGADLTQAQEWKKFVDR